MNSATINKTTSSKYVTWLLGVFLLSFMLGYISFLYKDSSETNILNTSFKIPVQGHSLVTHNGKELTDDNFSGYWSFVFFGFTNCPDVCPATLSQLSLLNKMLHDDKKLSDKTQFLFVSVDPDRDSLEHLADYVAYYHSEFIGVTGKMVNILKFEKQFGAFHKFDKSDKSGFYNVAHTSSVFLVDPQGNIALEFTPPLDIKNVTQQLTILMKDFNKKLS